MSKPAFSAGGKPRPTVDEIQRNPSYPTAIWEFKPVQSGRLDVAAGRGGPFKLYWELHGSGKTKIVWIMGLGAIMSGWQRQILKFGHLKGDQYSSLFFDNRGIGKSDVPYMRYTTSEMARDTLELIDNLGWKDERQLHIIGISMGGMIALELAMLIPTRIASLNLCSTCARYMNSLSYYETLQARMNLFFPRSLDKSIADAAQSMFPDKWLDEADSVHLPQPGDPGVVIPTGGKYGMFDTNYERFAAQELTKRLDTEHFSRTGVVLAALAVAGHNKTKAQLEEISRTVGAKRILVLHGTEDKLLSVSHGQLLIDQLKPRKSFIVEGSGHVILIEKAEWHDEMIETQLKECEAFGKS